MSLVRAGNTLSKAEEQLRTAVAKFEKDLDLDQKKTLHAYRLQAHQSPPDVSDVMRITAEIDCEVSKQKGFRGRCFGPRFTNILQAVQQFASLGDVIVGGSQNMTACGVWSLVRFSLLLMAKFSACVEKLSKLLMDVGRAAPRYQEMSLLYPQSQSLRSNLCEYFTVVVRLCHHLIKFTKQSVFQQMWSFLSDQAMASFQSELDQWAVAIKEEMSLLLNTSIEKQGSRLRAFMESEKVRRREKTKLRVLNYFSTYDHQATWKEIRKAGNTGLIHRSHEYVAWKNATESSTLVCHGKLGSGKSVLLANIVSDLSLNGSRDTCTVAYFFCRHDIHKSLERHTIMGSLVRQLLMRVRDLTKLERFMDQQGSANNLSSSVLDFIPAYQILQQAFPTGSEAYIVLDGLDECEKPERDMLYDQLRILQEAFFLRICISMRLEPDSARNEQQTEQLLRIHRMVISDNNNTEDIANFIHDELIRRIDSGRLTLGDPTLVLEISDALSKRAQGMFLWVVLQIESLCEAKTDAEIYLTLDNLPGSLSETFYGILRRASATGSNYQVRILELISTACRPFTTEELREVLSVEPGNRVWDSKRLINNIFSALATCGCLVIVDEETFAVRFIHQSVVQFLFGEFQHATTEPLLMRDKAARSMGDVVITYLSYDVFQAQLSRQVAPQIQASEAPSRIIQSISIPNRARSIAIKLLQSQRTPDLNIGELLVKHMPSTSPLLPLGFYQYAKDNWLHHSRSISHEKLGIRAMLRQVAEQQAVLEKGETLEDWAARQRHAPLIGVCVGRERWEILLLDAIATGDVDFTAIMLNSSIFSNRHSDETGPQLTHLWWSAVLKTGSVDTIRRILQVATPDFSFMTIELFSELLDLAINHQEIAEILFACKEVPESLATTFGIDTPDPMGKTLLYKASQLGWIEVVIMLLNSGASIHLAVKATGETPLFPAVRGRFFSLAKMLLDRGASTAVHCASRQQTPLMIAAAQRDKNMMHLLLVNKAYQHAQDADGRTALTHVARGTKSIHPLGCLVMLFDQGLSVDGTDRYERTALSYAAQHNDLVAVEFLLAKGAKLDLKDQQGRTALSYAAEYGDKSLVQLLLLHGAFAHSLDKWGRTPLYSAARRGEEEIFKLLYPFSGDPNNKDQYGRTVMFQAAECNAKQIVEFLVSEGADVNAVDRVGRTALSHAAEHGAASVVEYLCFHFSTNISIKDAEGWTAEDWIDENDHSGIRSLFVRRRRLSQFCSPDTETLPRVSRDTTIRGTKTYEW